MNGDANDRMKNAQSQDSCADSLAICAAVQVRKLPGLALFKTRPPETTVLLVVMLKCASGKPYCLDRRMSIEPCFWIGHTDLTEEKVTND